MWMTVVAGSPWRKIVAPDLYVRRSARTLAHSIGSVLSAEGRFRFPTSRRR